MSRRRRPVRGKPGSERPPYFELDRWEGHEPCQSCRTGRPYLYFIENAEDDGAKASPAATPCLLSMGPDGIYDQGGNDDIVINIAGN